MIFASNKLLFTKAKKQFWSYRKRRKALITVILGNFIVEILRIFLPIEEQ